VPVLNWSRCANLNSNLAYWMLLLSQRRRCLGAATCCFRFVVVLVIPLPALPICHPSDAPMTQCPDVPSPNPHPTSIRILKHLRAVTPTQPRG
jgi:hypothetical protein